MYVKVKAIYGVYIILYIYIYSVYSFHFYCNRKNDSNLTGVAGDPNADRVSSIVRTSVQSSYVFALLDDLLDRSLLELLFSAVTKIRGPAGFRNSVPAPNAGLNESKSSLDSTNEMSRFASDGTKPGLVSVALNESLRVNICKGCCAVDPLVEFIESARRQRQQNATAAQFWRPSFLKLLADDSIGEERNSSDAQNSKPLWTKLVADERANRLQALFKPRVLKRCKPVAFEQMRLETSDEAKTVFSATACACI